MDIIVIGNVAISQQQIYGERIPRSLKCHRQMSTRKCQVANVSACIV